MKLTCPINRDKPASKHFRPCLGVFIILGAVILLAAQGQAAVLSWSGGSASSANWNDSGNWGFAGIPATGDTLIFPASQPRLVNTNNIAGLTLNQIRFVGAAGGYVIWGNAFTLTNGIPATNSAGVNTINNNITLAVTVQTVNVGSGASLTLAGALSGVVGVTKTGAGTLTYSGPAYNSYSGPTVVNGGLLALGKPSGEAIGSGGSLTVSGATVRELASYQCGYIPVTVNAGGLLDLNTFYDTIGNSLTLSGGGSVQTGAGGTLALDYDSTITVASGSTCNINGTGALILSGPCSIVCNSDLNIYPSIGGSGTITKSGGGNLYLRSANTYTGLTVVSAGYLRAYNTRSLGTTNSGTVVSNGASLVLEGPVAITNEALILNGTGAPGYGSVDSGGSSGISTWAGPITVNATSTLVPYSSGATFRIIGPISGAGGVTLWGSGTNYYEGSTANTYAGTTQVDSEMDLVLKKSVSNGAIPNDLLIYGTVRLNANNQVVDSADVLVSSGALFDFGAYYDEIDTLHGSGTVNFGTGGWITVGLNNGTSTFDGLFTGVGYAPGWTVGKTGTGTFTMNGNHTFSAGRFTISSGVMVINGAQPQTSVLVDFSGSLRGTGTVGPILAYGNLQPGASAGCLTSSNLTFSSSGDLYVELNGTTPCTGYDQLVVRGTNNLANATLHVTTAFPPGDPVSLGDQFIILNNDGAEAVTGTFNGLTNGAEFAVGDYRFRINYGNDVILTAVGLPIEGASVAVSTGNGNHALDPNECNFLDLILANPTATPMNNVAAVLSTTQPRAMITQPYSHYPNIPVGNWRTNNTPFQIATLPNIICGSSVPLHLAVTTATHGSFVVPVTLNVGGATGTPLRYDNSVSVGIPDVGTIESTNTVAGFSGPLGKVVVSLWLTHTFDSDLDISLIAPDGTTVELSSGNGGGGDDYGTACSPDSSRTTFDDAAAAHITAGSAPFVGTYIPEGSLASVIGGVANGNWRLQITDNFGGSLGTLRCWSLSLYSLTCTDGGGFCEVCLPSINGVIEASDPRQTNRWFREGVVASCGVPKAWYGDFGATGTNFHHDVYTFTNLTGADACVTVSLQSANDVMAAMYLNSFNPADIAQNYHGDAGSSTAGGRTIFSATVPAGARFLVTVNEESQNSGTQPYTLQLSGLPCPPPTLAIAPAGPPDQVRLHWPTSAGGYELEAKPALTPGGWNPVPNEPIVGGARYHVTNSNTSPPDQFYRLRKSQ